MSQINIPNVGVVDFPDEMSDAEISAAIQSNFPEIHQQQAPMQAEQESMGQQPIQADPLASQAMQRQMPSNQVAPPIDLRGAIQDRLAQRQAPMGGVGGALTEFAAAVNRGAVNLADFMTTEQINNILQLSGQGRPMPTIGEQPIVQQATTGEFMDPGLARRAVRTAGEFVAPTVAGGAALRTAAGMIPKTVAPTTAQRVITQMADTPGREALLAPLAGVGQEVGAEVGKAVGGEKGAQVGRLVGGVALPVGTTFAKESAKVLVTKSAKKLLKEAAPTIEGLKQSARQVYKEIDDLGVTVNPGSVSRLGEQLRGLVRGKGFSPKIHPKVDAALKEFEAVAGKSQSMSDVDILRRIAGAAAKSTEPDEARLGSLMVNKIDDFLDTLGKGDLSSPGVNVGPKYRDARQIWRRVKKAELIQEAVTKADLQATGFENGIRTQFRSILNNKKKSKGFTPEELNAMREVVKGTSLQNIAKMLGKFGFNEGQASNMLMGSLGVAGGAAIGGAPGAVAVPLIGQMSRKLARKLTKEAARGADLVVRAGKNGLEITKAYMKITKPGERSAQELTELLLRPDISIAGLRQAVKNLPEKKLINDAVFLVNAIKSAPQEEVNPEQSLPLESNDLRYAKE